MAPIPNSDRAILEIGKIKDYCLSPEHPRGRHKARVFRDVLDLGQKDAEWLCEVLLKGVQVHDAIEHVSDRYGTRWVRGRAYYPKRQELRSKNNLDCTDR